MHLTQMKESSLGSSIKLEYKGVLRPEGLRDGILEQTGHAHVVLPYLLLTCLEAQCG